MHDAPQDTTTPDENISQSATTPPAAPWSAEDITDAVSTLPQPSTGQQAIVLIYPDRGPVHYWFPAGEMHAWVNTNYQRLCEQNIAGANIYYSTGAFSGSQDTQLTSGGGRTKDNCIEQCSLFVDIDAKDQVIETVDACMGALDKLVRDASLLPPTTVVNSGRGVHAYWICEEPIDLDVWEVFSEVLVGAAHHFNIKIDAKCTTDRARILRLPGFINHKNGALAAVAHTSEPRITHDALVAMLEPHIALRQTRPARSASTKAAQAQNQFAGVDLSGAMDATLKGEGMVTGATPSWAKLRDASKAGNGCRIIQWAMNNQADVEYGLWTGILSIAKRTDDEDGAIVDTCSDHPEYDLHTCKAKAAEFDGPRTCAVLEFDAKDSGCTSGCDGCPMKGKITSPLIIGYPDFDLRPQSGAQATEQAIAQAQREQAQPPAQETAPAALPAPAAATEHPQFAVTLCPERETLSITDFAADALRTKHPLPRPYSYNDLGQVVAKFKYLFPGTKPASHGLADGDREVLVFPHPVITDRVARVDGTKELHINFVRQLVGKVQIAHTSFTTTVLSKSAELDKRATDEDIDFTAVAGKDITGKAAVMSQFLKKLIEVEATKEATAKPFKAFGPDNKAMPTAFIYGNYKYIAGSTVVEPCTIAGDDAQNMADLMESPPTDQADFERRMRVVAEWKERIASINAGPRLAPHRALYAMIMASPFVPFNHAIPSSERGSVVMAYSTASGSGKTSLVNWARAVYAKQTASQDPMLVDKETGSTEQAFNTQVRGPAGSLPVYWDEILTNTPEEKMVPAMTARFTRLAMESPGSGARGRLTSAGTSTTKAGDNQKAGASSLWFCSSNVDPFSLTGIRNKAAMARVIAVHFPEDDGNNTTAQKIAGAELGHWMKTNGAVVGQLLVQNMMANLAHLNANYTKWFTRVDEEVYASMGGVNSAQRFRHGIIAHTMAFADTASQLGLMPFDLDLLWGDLKALLTHNVQEVTARTSVDIEQVVTDYRRAIENAIVVDRAELCRIATPFYTPDQRTYANEVKGREVITPVMHNGVWEYTGKIHIAKAAFDRWAKEHGLTNPQRDAALMAAGAEQRPAEELANLRVDSRTSIVVSTNQRLRLSKHSGSSAPTMCYTLTMDQHEVDEVVAQHIAEADRARVAQELAKTPAAANPVAVPLVAPAMPPAAPVAAPAAPMPANTSAVPYEATPPAAKPAPTGSRAKAMALFGGRK
jgi:hypothetical protein